ncbi:Flp pilus assembly protein CpaB [Chelatococcus sambhunathii]|uniref:Flp pilus assembly protein CpaB n=1 Tax=Chelatococcus sambhunathii TaxID=363953 RepID=A0ABU1DDZ9_9HYPH|nr:Flp pilus assembly protein CpaB [Chelatococcus sambhunathii]MDR4306268.1 Flp pilus assembly protein CpaB [Chelatococcus sambhunathii]
MKAARLAVLGIALAAGAGAAYFAGGSGEQPEQSPAPVSEKPLPTVEVLVAAHDIALGGSVRAEDLRWQAWPMEAASAAYLQKSASPDAIEKTAGSIARSPFVAGEPIRPEKLIKSGNGSGYMAAILPAGMRAISIEISPETGAGGFILPNDRVDVLLTRRQSGRSGRDESYTQTLSENIRVLAIDQMVEDKDGQKVVVGKTATLELTPQQAEMISLSRQQGVISLALRALVDSGPTAVDPNAAPADPRRGNNTVTIVRFGVASQGGQ